MTDEKIAIGLMSGTSTDGIDAAAVRFRECDGRPTVELLGFLTSPYPEDVRRLLLSIAGGNGDPGRVARTGFLLGELSAQAVKQVMNEAGLSPATVVVIGNAGHTVAHLPFADGSLSPVATMQIGEAAVIAERTGVTVVSDFRARDVAAGGQGAPLVPYFDFHFLRSDSTNRAALNIGGIANVAMLPTDCSPDSVIAFDTGPGNMPIDAAVRALFPGQEPFDRDGDIARHGCVHEELLHGLLRHPYFAKTPPKSCGHEQFGGRFVADVRRRAPELPAQDLVATFTALSARSAGEAIAKFAESSADPWEIIVSGGGAHNPLLTHWIAHWSQMTVRLSDDLGVPTDAKEAIAFAFFACETLDNRPTSMPSVTGARGTRVLGNVTPP